MGCSHENIHVLESEKHNVQDLLHHAAAGSRLDWVNFQCLEFRGIRSCRDLDWLERDRPLEKKEKRGPWSSADRSRFLNAKVKARNELARSAPRTTRSFRDPVLSIPSNAPRKVAGRAREAREAASSRAGIPVCTPAIERFAGERPGARRTSFSRTRCSRWGTR